MRLLMVLHLGACTAPGSGDSLPAGPTLLIGGGTFSPLQNQLYDNGDCSADPPMSDSIDFAVTLNGSVPSALEISFGEISRPLTFDGRFTWSDGGRTIAGSIDPDGARPGYWPSRTLRLSRFEAETSHENGACQTVSDWSGELKIELR